MEILQWLVWIGALLCEVLGVWLMAQAIIRHRFEWEKEHVAMQALEDPEPGKLSAEESVFFKRQLDTIKSSMGQMDYQENPDLVEALIGKKAAQASPEWRDMKRRQVKRRAKAALKPFIGQPNNAKTRKALGKSLKQVLKHHGAKPGIMRRRRK